jgi:hypothetical protein
VARDEPGRCGPDVGDRKRHEEAVERHGAVRRDLAKQLVDALVAPALELD